MTEEDRISSDWVLAYDTNVLRADGKPVSATSTDYTETPNEIGRYDYTYTANSGNQPTTITSLFYSNNQWNYDKRQTYTYNTYGGLTQVNVEEYYNGGGWVLIEQATCISDMENLQQVTVQEYNSDLNAWENSRLMTLAWTGDQVTEYIEKDWSGSGWQNSGRVVFSYSGQNQISQVTMEEWINPPGSWTGVERSTFTFDAGLWSEELIEGYSPTLGWMSEWKGEMSYNDDGFPTMQIGYNWEDISWTMSERMTFLYDGSANADDHTPEAPLLVSNYPNPFTSRTTITCKLPKSGSVELSIYNLRGQLVRTLVNEPLSSGQHTIAWDGKDDHGKAMVSGMYLCRISSAGKQETHKMLLMK